jgi:hypothetical protein
MPELVKIPTTQQVLQLLKIDCNVCLMVINTTFNNNITTTNEL